MTGQRFCPAGRAADDVTMQASDPMPTLSKRLSTVRGPARGPAGAGASPPSLDGAVLGLMGAGIALRKGPVVGRFVRDNGYVPNLARPIRLEEKLLWRKLVDRNPLFVALCDRAREKDFVARLCPGLTVPATRWMGQVFPAQFDDKLTADVVLLANHRRELAIGPEHFDLSSDVLQPILYRWLDTQFGFKEAEWGSTLARRCLLIEDLPVPPWGSYQRLEIDAVPGGPLLITAICGTRLGSKRTAYFRASGARLPALEAEQLADHLPLDYDLPSAASACLGHVKALSAHLDYARYSFEITASGPVFRNIDVYPRPLAIRRAAGPHARRILGELAEAWDLKMSWFMRNEQLGRPLWEHYRSRLLRRADIAGSGPTPAWRRQQDGAGE